MKPYFCISITGHREVRYPHAFYILQRGLSGDLITLIKKFLGPHILSLSSYGLSVPPNGGRLCSIVSNITYQKSYRPIRYIMIIRLLTLKLNLIINKGLLKRGLRVSQRLSDNVSEAISLSIAYITLQNFIPDWLYLSMNNAKPRCAILRRIGVFCSLTN